MYVDLWMISLLCKYNVTIAKGNKFKFQSTFDTKQIIGTIDVIPIGFTIDYTSYTLFCLYTNLKFNPTVLNNNSRDWCCFGRRLLFPQDKKLTCRGYADAVINNADINELIRHITLHVDYDCQNKCTSVEVERPVDRRLPNNQLTAQHTYFILLFCFFILFIVLFVIWDFTQFLRFFCYSTVNRATDFAHIEMKKKFKIDVTQSVRRPR